MDDRRADARGWVSVPVATPALLIDRSTLVANLDELAGAARAAGVELFPHAKTHRMTQFARLQLERGADGLCVAKLGEAEQFAAGGARRIFVAYPVVGLGKAERATALSARIDLTLGTDSVEAAEILGRAHALAGLRARLLLAIDTGLGREGVDPRTAPDLAERIAAIDGVDLVGVYTHEGSVYGATDPADLIVRARATAETIVGVAESIRGRGISLPIVSMGSSASVRVVATVPGVTQIRPGISAVNDLGQIALGTATLDTTAIRVIATIVSHPEPARALIDAGSKALSADLVLASGFRDAYPGYGMLVNAPGWVIERLSEEHGWLSWQGDGDPSPLPVGTRVEIVPNHACMVFAGLRQAAVIESGRVIETWDGFGPGSSE